MGGLRDVKRRARQALHQRMAGRVLYRRATTDAFTVVTARLHLQTAVNGELLRGGYSEVHELTPRAVFLLSEVRPARGAVIFTQDNGAWRVDNELPPDGLTITAELVRVPDSQIAAWGFNPAAEFCGAPMPGGGL